MILAKKVWRKFQNKGIISVNKKPARMMNKYIK